MDVLLVPGAWLGPMFDSRAEILGIPASAFVLLVGVALVTVGLLWIRHVLGPDELTRGEARWRYRDRGPVERLDEALQAVQPPRRTRGWWLTRIEFAIAIGAIALPTQLLLGSSSSMGGGVQLGLPALLVLGAGYGGMLFGLAWMIRIYRSPMREGRGASWRYRDR